jgi:hypothetical protein
MSYSPKKALERHKEFQFGSNPMKMSPFEESLHLKEQSDRKKATVDYIEGIQGRDGGYFADDPRISTKACPQ